MIRWLNKYLLNFKFIVWKIKDNKDSYINGCFFIKKIFGKNIVFFLYDEDYMMKKSNFYMCSRKKEK